MRSKHTVERRTCAHCGSEFSFWTGSKQRGLFCTFACYQASRGPVRERFDRNFAQQPRGCWEWTGRRNLQGYGNFSINSRKVAAHRVAWTLANGPIPAGMHVCHHCDNPPCVRPDHLFLGTAADNIRDRNVKGHTARGERHGSRTKPEALTFGDRNGSRRHPESRPRGDRHANTRLTESDIRSIRLRYASGLSTQMQLAAEFGVGHSTISNIVRRQVWSHIK
jgi:hypothetical protein